MNSIVKFLCLCAGVNLKLISKYPTEISKYSSIGGTILFTGFFAALSGGYAFYKIFNNVFYALILGFIWGLMIFNLDRYIVMSIKKKDSFLKELPMAIPRIILAIIISIVVAKPLEVKIFADRIAREIGDKQLNQMINEREKINDIFGINKTESNLNSLAQKIESNELKLNQNPNNKRFNELESKKTQLKSKKKQLELEKQKLQTKISGFFRAYEYNVIENGVEVKKKATRKIHLPSGTWNKIRNTVVKRDRKIKELENLEVLVEELERKIQKEKENYSLKTEEAIEILGKEKNRQDSIKISKEQQFAIQIQEMDSINKIAFSDNFVTQIEALGSLTQYQKSVYDNNGKIIQKANNTLYWMNMAIIILFMVIETTPIFVKLIGDKGQYDIVLEAENSEKESQVISGANINILNDEQNEELIGLSSEKNKATKLELVNKTLDSWKQKKLEEIENVTDNSKFETIIKEVLGFNKN